MGNLKNNLFDFATKELSQDAIICWLINCFNDENREIGEYFIKKFIFKNKKEIEIESVERPEKQKFRTDVFVKINTNIGKFIIIIEDKVSTFLHGNQLENSIERISKYDKENCQIMYLLFKSDNILGIEKNIYQEQQENIKGKYNLNIDFNLRTSKDMYNALKNNTNNFLLEMIIDYYEDMVKQNEESVEWKSIISAKQWNRFYNELNRNLQKVGIILADEGEPQRPRGSSQREYRSNYYIPKELENKLNKVIQDVKWLIIIDWKTSPEIRLYCDVSQDKYKSFRLFSEIEKNKAKQRKELIIKINEKLQDLNKMNMKCKIQDNALGIIKKHIFELSQIINVDEECSKVEEKMLKAMDEIFEGIEEILKIVEEVVDETIK